MASTTQMYNPRTGTWDDELLRVFAIPASILPELQPPGTVLCGLLPHCSFIASATGRRVLAGPVEATAIGNILTQALTMGEINSLPELKSIVRVSTEVKVYEPSGASS